MQHFYHLLCGCQHIIRARSQCILISWIYVFHSANALHFIYRMRCSLFCYFIGVHSESASSSSFYVWRCASIVHIAPQAHRLCSTNLAIIIIIVLVVGLLLKIYFVHFVWPFVLNSIAFNLWILCPQHINACVRPSMCMCLCVRTDMFVLFHFVLFVRLWKPVQRQVIKSFYSNLCLWIMKRKTIHRVRMRTQKRIERKWERERIGENESQWVHKRLRCFVLKTNMQLQSVRPECHNWLEQRLCLANDE